MGLVICKRLIEANEGTIEIDSEGKDMGCTVKFTMKMSVPPENEIGLIQEGQRDNNNNSIGGGF